ncbi:MAG TPA: hypothetical protein PLS63_10495 [Microthrixaceae bacterium]|nr:hypothetical protein [Microthrixaceae bacterium]
MNIEQFYDADPRRRHSKEEQFGRDWMADDGVRWEINWVVDTGEVYAMREPMEPGTVDPVGDTWVADMPVDLVTVDILGVVTDEEALTAALAGWQDHNGTEASLAWVTSRVATVVAPSA